MKRIFLWVLVIHLSVPIFSQDLEIAGKAIIKTMNLENKAEKIVVRLKDGTLAIRDLHTIPDTMINVTTYDTIYQILSISNDTIYLTGGGFVELPPDQVNDADSNPTNEIQDLSLNGNTLSLTGDATTIDLSGYLDDTNTQLSDEQVQDKAGAMASGNTETLITVTYQDADGTMDYVVNPSLNAYTNDAGFLTSEVDGSVTNEKISALEIMGDSLVLTEGSMTMKVAVDSSNTNELQTWSTLDGIPLAFLDGLDNVDDLDADPANEIQDLSLSGNTLSLTGDATTVDLSGYLDNTDDQGLSVTAGTSTTAVIDMEDGTNVTIEAGAGLSISETTSKITLSNSAPDQTVAITGAGISAVTGTYPNFTVTSTEVDGSITNEIQNLSSVLSQSNDGGGSKITNIADPMADQDAATKAYVEDLLASYGIGTEIVTDVDGNLYNSVKIGSQYWMVENLRTTKYSNSKPIHKVSDLGTWGGLSSPAYTWYSFDSTSYASPYGALYNYYAVADTNRCNICPTGWIVPSDDDWTTLTDYLGGLDVAGGKLKEIGTMHWNNPNVGPTQNNLFNALPGGNIDDVPNFVNIGIAGSYWSNDENDANTSKYRYMIHSSDDVFFNTFTKKGGFSVRCLKCPESNVSVQSLLDGGQSPIQIISKCIPVDSLYGKTYAGGLIFYVDVNDDHPFEGLVAAPPVWDGVNNPDPLALWGCYGTSISGADGTAIGTGAQNTVDIEAGCSTAGIAAELCANHTDGTYSDWFLPSKDELNEMYLKIGQGAPAPNTNIGGFASNYYWSSSELDAYYAWKQFFTSGGQNNYVKVGFSRVRAVRAF